MKYIESMRFKEYLFTSLVFVNLTIGISNIREEPFPHNKKNKEVLKVATIQEEPTEDYSVGETRSLFNFSQPEFKDGFTLSVAEIILLGLALGAMLGYVSSLRLQVSFLKKILPCSSQTNGLNQRKLSKSKHFFASGIIPSYAP